MMFLHYNILHDSLTTLPNRVYFNKCISEAAEGLKQNKTISLQ